MFESGSGVEVFARVALTAEGGVAGTFSCLLEICFLGDIDSTDDAKMTEGLCL